MATITMDRSTLENALRSAAAKYRECADEFRKDIKYLRVTETFERQAREADAMADGVAETDIITLRD